MSSPSTLAVAVVVWSLGASIYTWDLWRARGLTDNGFLGLLAMIAGSLLMARELLEWPLLVLAVLAPAVLSVWIGYTKAACVIRAWSRRPRETPPAILPREPASEPLVMDPKESLFYVAPSRLPPAVGLQVERVIAQAEQDMLRNEQEHERAQRIGRMFGG